MAHGGVIDLPRRAASEKVLHDKAFNLLKDQDMIISNADFLQWFIYIF